MPKEEDGQKVSMSEAIEGAIHKALLDARLEDRTVNSEQFKVLEDVYKALSELVNGETRIDLHPAFSAGGIAVVTETVFLSDTEVSKLRSTLAACNTLSIEPLTNGNIEIGVTVPNVFNPLPENNT